MFVYYQIYDYPPKCNYLEEVVHSQLFYSVMGDEFAVLADHTPPDFLTHHWQKWLPVFKPAKYTGFDEALKNQDVPIVTHGPFESIPRMRHSVDPDVLYQIHSKSAIPEIGVPCPRYMDRNNVEFPCVVKVDWSYGGIGNSLVKNERELNGVIKKVRKSGWKGNIICQEFIENIEDVMNVTFYVNKTGDVYWIQANSEKFNGFHWISLTSNWNEQESLKERFYDDFVAPVAQYLHKKGYLGGVNVELVLTAQEKKLVDLNPRFPGDLTPALIAPYMSNLGFPSWLFYKTFSASTIKPESLVAKANQINESQNVGRVLVFAAGNGENGGSSIAIAVFAKTGQDCEMLNEQIKTKDAGNNKC